MNIEAALAQEPQYIQDSPVVQAMAQLIQDVPSPGSIFMWKQKVLFCPVVMPGAISAIFIEMRLRKFGMEKFTKT